ncbi:MAG: HDOD domain-containing protein [Sedimentisphaerales bacterium]
MPDKPPNIQTATRQVELAVGRLSSLSTLPGAGAKLFSELLRGQLSPSAMIELTESDPAFAAGLLSLIGRRALIPSEGRFSLRQALDKLGPDEIRDAALSIRVAAPRDPEEHLRTGLWLHSLAVACCAGDIAAELALPGVNPETAYWAGLLHDIGKLALLDAMPKSLARIFEQAESAEQGSRTIEREHIGIEHTAIGKHLAQRWALPDFVVLAAWLHHSETVTIAREAPETSIAVVVQLADSIARQSGIGRSGSFDAPEPIEPLTEHLGIDVERLRDIHQNLLTAVEERSRVLALDVPNAASDYAEAVHAAASRFARQQVELTEENRELKSASSHLDFVTDFLLGLSSTASPLDIAEDFAVRWQKFYQTGMVCLYLTPLATCETFEAVIVENLSQSRLISLNVSEEGPVVPKAITNTFAILNAYDHIPWLLEQTDVDFDVNRTKLVPLLSGNKAIGAIAFELHYPGDVKLFEDRFKTSASIAAVVLDMALAQEGHQYFAENFARLIAKPSEPAPPTPQPERSEGTHSANKRSQNVR